MRFDFTKHRANTSPKPMNGDVRIRAIKDAYYIEFGNSAIDKLGIDDVSWMRFAFNEVEDEAGRTYEANRYMGFEFYDYEAIGSRKVRKASGYYYVTISGKADRENIRTFLRGSDSKEFKLFKDAYSDERQYVIDSKNEWNEEKGAMLSSRYRRSK